MGLLGSIAGGLFGAGASLLSGNREAKDITGAANRFAAPYADTGVDANNFLADFLMGSGGGDQLARFNDTTGYNFLLDSGRRAIGGNMAAQGKLNSGATGKALVEFGQNLGSTQLDKFLSQIGGLASRGVSAGNSALSAYGDAASAKSEGRAGAGSVIGDLLGSIF
jgi:hypothetical protein